MKQFILIIMPMTANVICQQASDLGCMKLDSG